MVPFEMILVMAALEWVGRELGMGNWAYMLTLLPHVPSMVLVWMLYMSYGKTA